MVERVVFIQLAFSIHSMLLVLSAEKKNNPLGLLNYLFYICVKVTRIMPTTINLSNQSISTIDALWTLIQSQKQSVRKALLKRFMETEMYADETVRQQAYICNTIEKGWKEVKSSMKEGRSLKSADDLLTELKTLK